MDNVTAFKRKLGKLGYKHLIVVCIYSGFNTDYGSSESLKTLVMLCYVFRFEGHLLQPNYFSLTTVHRLRSIDHGKVDQRGNRTLQTLKEYHRVRMLLRTRPHICANL